MKSILKVSLAAVITTTVLLASCGKYEDGPAISLRSKEARLCREWMDPGCTSGCGTIEFKKDGTMYSNGTIISGATWSFSSDKKSLIYTFTVLGSPFTSSEEITRLTSKELWTKDSSGDIDKLEAK